jgi:hypothetical protein
VTRTCAEEHLCAPAGAAGLVTALAAIRHGRLIFMRARYTWCGTAEAAMDVLPSGRHGNSIPIALR